MATKSLLVLVVTVSLLLSSCGGSSLTDAKAESGSGSGQIKQRRKRSDDSDPLETVVTQLSQEVTSLKAQLEATRNEVNSDIQGAKGSTFIRWGSSHCPASSQVVYSGIAGGSWWNDEGGSANRLCLTLQPEFDNTNHHSTEYSKIFGAEYQFIGDAHNFEVPCALCRAAQASTVMIPGTKTCPSGWTVQYWGHLTGSHFGYHGVGEYLCLDSSPEGRGDVSNRDGALFFYTIAKCGSLPCPPYLADRVVTCVVCSQ